MERVVLNTIYILGLFLLWTFLVYLMHRLAHIRHKHNLFHAIHLSHHKIDYLNANNRKFKWYYFFFYFGSLNATLDVLIMLTLPAFIVYFIYPPLGIYILIFHYLYEVLLSEGALDHNPAIKGRITSFFAWGEYHLTHHKTWVSNYGLVITFWDTIFKTNHIPASK